MRVVWTAVRLRLGPLLLTFKYQFYGIIAVAVEIVFSILTVGAAISLPLSIMNNIKVVNRHHVLKEMLQSPNKKCDYIMMLWKLTMLLWHIGVMQTTSGLEYGTIRT